MANEALTYDMLWQRAQTFQANHFDRARDFMQQLASAGQKPTTLFIGCVDSRVVPEMITGARPGDLFVTRTIANVVPAYSVSESAAGAVLEYAVRHLKVGHLVICGHTDCGGIKALDKALDSLKEPALARWVEHARPARQRVDSQSVPPEARHRAIVEENIRLQLEHVQTYACVREALQQRKLELHGWVYAIEDGQVTAL
jgi:carbonic anhydrase